MCPLPALQSPSVYSSYRKKALKYAVDSVISSIENVSEPLYIYGDFNFRLDFAAVIQVCVRLEISMLLRSLPEICC